MPNSKSRAAEIEIYTNCISEDGSLEWALECLRDPESSFVIDMDYDTIDDLAIDLYDQDNVFLFTFGDYGVDFHLMFVSWEKAHWIDDPDGVSNLEKMYGEEGTNYFTLHTKNKIHSFSESTPFGDDRSYDGAVERVRN